MGINFRATEMQFPSSVLSFNPRDWFIFEYNIWEAENVLWSKYYLEQNLGMWQNFTRYRISNSFLSTNKTLINYAMQTKNTKLQRTWLHHILIEPWSYHSICSSISLSTSQIIIELAVHFFGFMFNLKENLHAKHNLQLFNERWSISHPFLIQKGEGTYEHF